MLCVIPGYLLSLAIGFPDGQHLRQTCAASGTYDHYFSQFLDPVEVFYSLVKAVTFCAVITIIHCYYGFFASGGPEGGWACGRAIRAVWPRPSS